MEKLKTLIVIDNLHIGGVATSLYNYLHFTHNQLDIDLLVFNEESIDMKKIPNDVTVLKTSKILHVLGKNHMEIKRESFFLTFLRIVMILFARIKNGVLARNLIWPLVNKIGIYDLAIAYAQDDNYTSISKGCIDFIIKKVKAYHRSVIIHCDYRNFGGFAPQQIKIFNKLDSIICVSESCKNSFINCFQSLENKTIVCENFTMINIIRNLAGKGIPYPANDINFVSVCRLSKVKGLTRTVRAFSQLYKNGIRNFTWTIVGDGPEYKNLAELISRECLSLNIKLIKNKENPYPYIKNASYFLLPSFHEAAPMVFGEAASLGVPIFSTKTCSAIELVQNKGIGIIVENSYDGIYKGLKTILQGNVQFDFPPKYKQKINNKALRQFNGFIKNIKNWAT